MRASNKTRILDAAVRVINREGVRAVTFESVSSEAGLTRGGLLYHFPSREALLRGIDAHLVQAWEASMEALAGKPTAQTTAVERYEAYMRVSAQSATRAELLFMLESMDPETGSAPWNEAMLRWAPSPPAAGTVAPSAWDPFIARLAADGLWIYEAMYNGTLDAAERAIIVARLAQLLKPEPAS
ncbi:TetR/AcrR family transcriptional regulator [Stenotrophomonas sp. 169]|uniref:TetR/AcrR family transcriptional regulator n=1 Tax=Stenotrophomonas sp. 169 TaxID=2770322 RepID=UPI001662366C|nr:TetR/AcrR family transcriptional regulator [Stenotrophomonas sp. 169]QNR95834.1 TetR/AcrR family transcriptional regulator [Stenotrophomonas sp. 169]